jgi:hypothetical protein
MGFMPRQELPYPRMPYGENVRPDALTEVVLKKDGRCMNILKK